MAQPRWICTYRVDSMAMLSAYNAWRARIGDSLETINIEDLPLIMHHPRHYVNIPGTYTVSCNDPACPRCQHDLGGDVFRWYSPYWHDDYLRMRRFQDSWIPGEPELGPYTNPDWDLTTMTNSRRL